MTFTTLSHTQLFPQYLTLIPQTESNPNTPGKLSSNTTGVPSTIVPAFIFFLLPPIDCGCVVETPPPNSLLSLGSGGGCSSSPNTHQVLIHNSSNLEDSSQSRMVELLVTVLETPGKSLNIPGTLSRCLNSETPEDKCGRKKTIEGRGELQRLL